MTDSPIDQLLAQLKASLNARRADVLERAERIRLATAHYQGAVEQDLVRDFARNHGFGDEKPGKTSSREAAQALLRLVQALPELQGAAVPPEPNAAPAEARRGALTAAAESAPSSRSAPGSARGAATGDEPASAKAARAAEPTESPKSALPRGPEPDGAAARLRLATACKAKPLVVVGRLGKKDRLEDLARALPHAVEWLDTNQHGTAIVGNLDRRIREGRIGALVLMEGSLNHKHTQPLVSAARGVNLPLAYAHKGGKQSILRALDELEASLRKAVK